MLKCFVECKLLCGTWEVDAFSDYTSPAVFGMKGVSLSCGGPFLSNTVVLRSLGICPALWKPSSPPTLNLIAAHWVGRGMDRAWTSLDSHMCGRWVICSCERDRPAWRPFYNWASLSQGVPGGGAGDRLTPGAHHFLAP